MRLKVLGQLTKANCTSLLKATINNGGHFQATMRLSWNQEPYSYYISIYLFIYLFLKKMFVFEKESEQGGGERGRE